MLFRLLTPPDWASLSFYSALFGGVPASFSAVSKSSPPISGTPTRQDLLVLRILREAGTHQAPQLQGQPFIRSKTNAAGIQV